MLELRMVPPFNHPKRQLYCLSKQEIEQFRLILRKLLRLTSGRKQRCLCADLNFETKKICGNLFQSYCSNNVSLELKVVFMGYNSLDIQVKKEIRSYLKLPKCTFRYFVPVTRFLTRAKRCFATLAITHESLNIKISKGRPLCNRRYILLKYFRKQKNSTNFFRTSK